MLLSIGLIGCSEEKENQTNNPTIEGNIVDKDKDALNQSKTDNVVTDTILYNNTEYGYAFLLPKRWKGYQIVSNSWEGTTIRNQTNETVESGPILSIRHPEWTEENPRQDIPIMIFSLDQWKLLQQGKFHIGAAPVEPRKLGENNKYVFALPARYNFAFPEGYEEVEEILENYALQPENIESDANKIDKGIEEEQIESSLTKVQRDGYSFKYVIKNNSQKQVNLTFNTSQEFNYILWKKDAKGTMVYNFSEDKTFEKEFHKKTLEPGQELTYEIELSNDYETDKYILEVYMISNEPDMGSPTKFHQNLEFTYY